MGDLKISNIKRSENLVKLLIVCLSLIGFSLLLVGLKCHNNNIHISSNLHFNRLIAASYFRPLEPVAEAEATVANELEQTSSNSYERINSNSRSEAHHLFECVLFKYKIKNSELFLLLTYFTYLFITCITLSVSLISEGFNKNMDVIFHIIGFFLYLCSSVWILVEETEVGKSYETRKNIVASASIGLVCGMLHFIHALFCIKFS